METLNQFKIELPAVIGDAARVWIYQSSRKFQKDELEMLHLACSKFTNDWQAHGTHLVATYAIYFDRFICFFVDESHHGASGCSIDGSVRFIQLLEKNYSIALMDRMQVAWLKNGEVVTAHLHELENLYKSGEISMNTSMFNNLVSTKGEMEKSWLLPLSESWHRQMVS